MWRPPVTSWSRRWSHGAMLRSSSQVTLCNSQDDVACKAFAELVSIPHQLLVWQQQASASLLWAAVSSSGRGGGGKAWCGSGYECPLRTLAGPWTWRRGLQQAGQSSLSSACHTGSSRATVLARMLQSTGSHLGTFAPGEPMAVSGDTFGSLSWSEGRRRTEWWHPASSAQEALPQGRTVGPTRPLALRWRSHTLGHKSPYTGRAVGEGSVT